VAFIFQLHFALINFPPECALLTRDVSEILHVILICHPYADF